MVRPLVFGHRGSPDPATGVPENTLGSFARARRLGADGVELDVRATADGAVAVHHDPVVAGAGPVHQLVAADLPASVPLLPVVLEGCRGRLNIEVKNLPGEPGFDPDDRLARRVCRLVEEAGRGADVVVSSFWPGALEAVHAESPGLATGLLVAGWPDPAGAVDAAVARGCTAIHPAAAMVTPALVEEAHTAGLSVAVWTVNDPDAVRAMASAGVDALITDRVELALGALARG